MSNEIKIYHLSSSRELNIQQKLPDALFKRIQKKKQTTKRSVSMHAYQALFAQLEKDFNIHKPEIDYLSTGKPFIKDNPVHFNISHSHNEIAIAISKQHRVGIDIEAYRAFSNITAAFSFFTTKEQQLIQSDDSPEKKLIDLWTKKEAVIKAIGSEMFSIAHKIDITDNTVQWNNACYYCYPLNINIKGKGWMACTLSNYTPEESIFVKF